MLNYINNALFSFVKIICIYYKYLEIFAKQNFKFTENKILFLLKQLNFFDICMNIYKIMLPVKKTRSGDLNLSIQKILNIG